MQSNIHTPERLTGESMADYRARRKESRRANVAMRYRGPTAAWAPTNRTAQVRAAGGIRQFKRRQYAMRSRNAA